MQRHETSRSAPSVGNGAHSPSAGELRALVGSLPDMLYRYRFAPPSFEYVSPASLNLLGYSPDEFYADPGLAGKIAHPDDRQVLKALFEHPELFENPPLFRWIRKDGQVVWIEQRNTLILDEGGQIVAVQGIARDVTGAKREEDLRESGGNALGILEGAPSAICEIDFEGNKFRTKDGRKVDLVMNLVTEDLVSSAAKFPSENPNPILRIREDGVLLYANEASYHILLDWQLEVGGPAPAVLQQATSKALSGQAGISFDEEHNQRVISFFVVPILKSGYANLYGQDVTERKRAEVELRQLNRTLRALSNASQALLHATNEDDYLKEVCRIIVEDCGHAMAWVGYTEKDEAKSVRPMAHAGFEEGYIETLKLTWADSERGRGPTGTAIRTGQVAICRNMLTDPKFLPWREQALQRGYRSSIVFPMLAEGEAFGALTIYSREPDPFSEAEVALLTELTNDLTYGVNSLRLRAAHAQAEQALRDSEERFSKAFHHSPVGFNLFRITDGRSVDVNDAYLSLIGYSRDEVIGHTASELNVLVEPQEGAIWMHEARERGSARNLDVLVRRKSGEVVNALFSLVTIEVKGEVMGLVLAIDVTERKRVEEALRESEARFKVIASSTPDHLLVQNRELKYVFVINPQLGLREGDMIGRTDYDFLTKEDADNLTRIKKQVLETGVPAHVEVPLAPRKGEQEFFDGSYVPKFNEEGQIDGLIGYFRNVTERRRAEAEREELLQREEAARAEAEAAVRVRDHFITLASHELKTPLTSLKGYAELLMQRATDAGFDEQNARMVRTIYQQSSRLERMISRLLDINQIERGQLSLERTPIDLEALVTCTIRDIEPTLRRHTLQFTRSGESVIVNGDETRLHQVVQNLIQNAVKYSPSGGRISVRLTREEATARIAVRDEGIGIPSAALPSLFTLFYRADNAEAYHIGGLGVGLYVAREIVRMHGGDITITSEEGKGSEFVISLPLPEASPATS